MKYKTNWNSLNDFKNFLERETNEKIISFNGYELITKKATYGLVLGQLNIREKKKHNERV